MEMHLDDMLKQVTDFIEKEANVKTVVGEQFQLGDFSCVPIIRMGFGFGSGGGGGHDAKNNEGEGGGAGAGVGIQPIGFLVAKGDQISFIDTYKHSGLSSMFEQVPGLIEKFMDKKMEEDKKEETPA